MDGVIQRLPDPLINKIAAGEVIERPASVLKELAENSLDAGATRLEISLEAGGKNYLQVLDDGVGMSPEDARLALERHATSKLSRFEDLEALETMGFRGEALPSIASVSRLELQTRRLKDREGLRIRVSNGEIKDISPVGCAPGTRITVRNLFFSTPVRRKFLTSNRNELRHCISMLRRMALARPELELLILADGEELHDWRATDREGRIVQLFGSDMPTRLIPVEYKDSGIRVSGLVGKINTFRRSHGDQYLFVNGRPITSRVINHAVFSAYGHTLERDQVPFYALFLEVDPQRLDVNVHPTKKEVRFEDEHYLHRSVNTAVIRALSDRSVRNFDLDPQGRGVEPGLTVARPGAADTPAATEQDRSGERFPARQSAGSGRVIQGDFEPAASRYSRQDNLFASPSQNREAEEGMRTFLDSAARARERFSGEGRVQGDEPFLPTDRGGRSPFFQLHKTYLFAEVEKGVVIIDQHAAHERILYERCLDSMHKHNGSSQRLLFPVDLPLDGEDLLLFEEVMPRFFEMGFEMAMRGETVTLTGLPADLRKVSPEGLVQEILDQYRIFSSRMPDPLEAMAASVACKAAIKAGQALNDVEIRSLLDDLFACRQPFTCPHGRPVVINLGLGELDRRFGRS